MTSAVRRAFGATPDALAACIAWQAPGPGPALGPIRGSAFLSCSAVRESGRQRCPARSAGVEIAAVRTRMKEPADTRSACRRQTDLRQPRSRRTGHAPLCCDPAWSSRRSAVNRLGGAFRSSHTQVRCRGAVRRGRFHTAGLVPRSRSGCSAGPECSPGWNCGSRTGIPELRRLRFSRSPGASGSANSPHSSLPAECFNQTVEEGVRVPWR